MKKSSISSTSLLKWVGILVYGILAKVNVRFLLPAKVSLLVDTLRTRALVWQGASIGNGSLVRSHVFIAYPKNLKLGVDVRVGDFSRIYNFSQFSVGDHTEIGPGLHVQTNEHEWLSIDEPLAKQGSRTDAIEVGSGAYLGANVTLLSGVIVGSQTVLAAGAIVTKTVEKRAVYGGVPAKKIRDL